MDKKISFSYISQPYILDGRSLEIFRPFIPIKLSYAHGKISEDFDALLDSGSDTNLFPIDLGIIIGVNFRKSKKKRIMGIGKHLIDAYTSKTNIWIEGEKFATEIDFSPQQQTPLLGREAFFNLVKSINFRQNEKFVDIEFKDN